MKFPSIINRPYIYFWAACILILLKGLIDHFTNDDTITDINVHDTYYVIEIFHLAVVIALLYFAAGTIYRLLRNFKLIRSLVKLHILVSIGSVIAYMIVIPLITLTDDIYNDRSNIVITLLFILVSFVQLLFIANILIAVLRGRK